MEGLGVSWSEADIKRALTEGVRLSGVPLAPQMPVAFYMILTPRDLDAVAAYIKTAAPVRNQVPPPVYKAAIHAELIPNAERPIAEEACHIRRHRLQPRRGPAAVTMKPARDGLGEPPISSRGNSISIDLQRQGLRSWIGTVPGSGCAPQPELARWPRPAAGADPPQS
jgi:hypothetical protein